MAAPKSARTVRRYSKEFKLKAVALANLEGVQTQEVAEALVIHPFMLSRWKKEAREGKLVGSRGEPSTIREAPANPWLWWPSEDQMAPRVSHAACT